jgi:hypothetical protein
MCLEVICCGERFATAVDVTLKYVQLYKLRIQALSLVESHDIHRQTCSNAVSTTCQQDVFALLVPSLLTSCQRLVLKQLATRLLNSTDLLQVVPTTRYRPAIQQFVNKL